MKQAIVSKGVRERDGLKDLKQTRLNVILITIDSLRPDHLGYMGYSRRVSPHIDALARESIIFSRAFATGPITPHSFPAILTSTYPLDYRGPKRITRAQKLVSEVLKEQGFVTAAFHANAFLAEFFGYNRGWDFFEDLEVPEDPLSFQETRATTILKRIFRRSSLRLAPQFFFGVGYLRYRLKREGPKIKGALLTQLVKDFISSLKTGAPFFGWLHYMDVHPPYFGHRYYQEKPLSFSQYRASYAAPLLSHYPSRRLRKIAQRQLPLTHRLYDEGIEAVDEQIGSLISFLKARSLYDSCIIILTADHGEEFLEHGGGSHSTKLYNELLHVPLLIRMPGYPPRLIKNPVSLLDLPPTICDLLKIKRPFSFKGENIFSRSAAPVFHQTGLGRGGGFFSSEIELIGYCEIEKISQCQFAYQTADWKYILDYGSGREELYDLVKDAKEQVNLIPLKPPVINQMRETIEIFIKENPPLSLRR